MLNFCTPNKCFKQLWRVFGKEVTSKRYVPIEPLGGAVSVLQRLHQFPGRSDYPSCFSLLVRVSRKNSQKRPAAAPLQFGDTADLRNLHFHVANLFRHPVLKRPKMRIKVEVVERIIPPCPKNSAALWMVEERHFRKQPNKRFITINHKSGCPLKGNRSPY